MAIKRFLWSAGAAGAGLLIGLPGCSLPGAQVDPAAEAAAIRGLQQRLEAAQEAKDAAAASLLFAPDGVEMAPNSPPIVGRVAIRDWFAEWLEAPNVSYASRSEVIVVAESGDLAYDRGAYRFAVDGPQGRIEDTGKYLTTWKKVGGEWQIAADIFNSNKPATGP